MLVGGEKDRPTWIFFFNFIRLKIFWWLNEIKTHFENLDVSLSSFLRSFIEKYGFISMNKKYLLTEQLLTKLKLQIRKNVSPRHVPSKIIKVIDIPRTKSGKIVELAVKNTIEGNKIKNKEALINPEVLKYFKNLKDLNY